MGKAYFYCIFFNSYNFYTFGLQLKYWNDQIPEENALYYLSRSTKAWSLIVGLQPDTYYFVKVMAYNAAGEGPESERYLGNFYNFP